MPSGLVNSNSSLGSLLWGAFPEFPAPFPSMNAMHNATQHKVAHRPGTPGELGPQLGVQVKVSTAPPLADAQSGGVWTQ